jgi:endonuclease YncB( thermonuclease family)
VTGWAVLVGGEVTEVCDTWLQATDLAEWLVSRGGALVATVQPYDPDGQYLPDDHDQ